MRSSAPPKPDHSDHPVSKADDLHQASREYFHSLDLYPLLQSYLSEDDIETICRAYLFGAKAHSHQQRLSGEPYISHPLAVAHTMAELGLDATSITAGLLHDVIEDTGFTKEQIAEEFGWVVAEVVDGVSKLEELSFESLQAKQARNFQKMMLAIAKDVRVILVKLTDRLHNMRTIEYKTPERQKQIARETLDIYAPLAHRIGIERLGLELEELSFRVLYPVRYRVLENELRRYLGEKSQMIGDLIGKLRAHFESKGLKCEIRGRKKDIYSIYKKMRDKRLPLSKIADIFAVRILVDNVDECYRALGIVHGFSNPVPGRFKDYIALPKTNGYQSLHTNVLAPHGTLMEVQIRTRDMDIVAATGIASHHLYKVKGDERYTPETMQWLQNISEFDPDTTAYMENLKTQLQPDSVYLFTPDGEIIALPKNATALDFAFAIHTVVGLTTAEIKINHRSCALDTRLRSGQRVEVITDPAVKPQPEWLYFVVTAKARNAIHQHLRQLARDEAESLGETLLAKALALHDTQISDLSQVHMQEVAVSLGERDLRGLCYQIGIGEQVPELVAARLQEKGGVRHSLQLILDESLVGEGGEGRLISYAKCCYPLPGDELAVLTSSDGLVVHRKGCPNVEASSKDRGDPVGLHWPQDLPTDRNYSAGLHIVTPHRRGALAQIAAVIAQEGSNIESIAFDEHYGQYATIQFVISVSSKQALADLMTKIGQQVPDTEVHRLGLKIEDTIAYRHPGHSS